MMSIGKGFEELAPGKGYAPSSALAHRTEQPKSSSGKYPKKKRRGGEAWSSARRCYLRGGLQISLYLSILLVNRSLLRYNLLECQGLSLILMASTSTTVSSPKSGSVIFGSMFRPCLGTS